ncbi:MAG: RNA polymerase sigma factor [Candidatus Limiplasma sp.]|nr:RNA polymerase sigma factor [Candidatus Limiplasma sp.]
MQSFEALFSKYFRRVYRFALSLTGKEQAAEELTQQAFFKALKGIDSFQGRSDPVTWLCSIAKNEFFNSARRSREQLVAPDSCLLQRQAGCVEELVQRKDQVMRVHHHLHGMEEPYREVFSLRVFGELKFSQIAALFGKTESWARVTFYRAKCELQSKLREEDNESPHSM